LKPKIPETTFNRSADYSGQLSQDGLIRSFASDHENSSAAIAEKPDPVGSLSTKIAATSISDNVPSNDTAAIIPDKSSSKVIPDPTGKVPDSKNDPVCSSSKASDTPSVSSGIPGKDVTEKTDPKATTPRRDSSRSMLNPESPYVIFGSGSNALFSHKARDLREHMFQIRELTKQLSSVSNEMKTSNAPTLQSQFSLLSDAIAVLSRETEVSYSFHPFFLLANITVNFPLFSAIYRGHQKGSSIASSSPQSPR
jgi:hypothetical protein